MTVVSLSNDRHCDIDLCVGVVLSQSTLITGLRAVMRIVWNGWGLFLRVMGADHDGVSGCSKDGSDVGKQKWDCGVVTVSADHEGCPIILLRDEC